MGAVVRTGLPLMAWRELLSFIILFYFVDNDMWIDLSLHALTSLWPGRAREHTRRGADVRLEDWTYQQCVTLTGFRKKDVRRLIRGLGYQDRVVRTPLRRYKISGEAALVMKKLIFPL